MGETGLGGNANGEGDRFDPRDGEIPLDDKDDDEVGMADEGWR